MPYSKSPTYSTNETKRIDLACDIDARSVLNISALTDSFIENALIEKNNKFNGDVEISIKSRPKAKKSPSSSTGGTVGRGCYSWSNGSFNDVFYVYDNHLYSLYHGPVGNLSTSTGAVGFTDFLFSTGTSVLIVSDGTYLYSVTTGYVFTTITSVLATVGPHIPQPVYIDGYLFLAKQSTGDIYNSNLDTVDVWTAGNFITAEIYPDTVTGLAKNDNYLYVFGKSSVEFFYDAGNATGTPLARYAAGVLQVGTYSVTQNTIVQTDTSVMFVGQTNDGTISSWMIDGFKPTKISTPAIDRILQYAIYSTIPLSAFEMRVEGHKLYIITIPNYFSLVYDVELKVWTKWTTNTSSSSTYAPTNYLGQDACSTDNFNALFIQGSNGVMYEVSNTISSNGDDSNTYTTVIQTNELDFDTYNKKFMSRLVVLIRENLNTFSTNNTVSIRWSDDGYATWSSARTLPTGYSMYPFIYKLGSFRRRAFQLQITNISSWKLDGLEVSINKGSI